MEMKRLGKTSLPLKSIVKALREVKHGGSRIEYYAKTRQIKPTVEEGRVFDTYRL